MKNSQKATLIISSFCLLLFTNPKAIQAANPTLSWSTYLGGSELEHARDIAFDSQGNVYVVGGTESTNFADSTKRLGQSFGGSSCNSGGSATKMDVFIAKFSPQGQLIWWQYLGGPCYDRAYAVETVSINNQTYIYVAGRAGEGFPTTPGVIQSIFAGDIFDRSAFYGAQDGFIVKLRDDGTVTWSTYLGTKDMELIRDIAVDSQGNVYAGLAKVGTTFPPQIQSVLDQSPLRRLPHSDHQQQGNNGTHDPVLIKLNSSGTQVLFGTYLGGSNEEEVPAVRLDSSGNIFISYSTHSTDNPVHLGFQTQNGGGSMVDSFLIKINPAGSAITYGTYIGGSGNEGGETHFLAVDNYGHAYVSNYTDSTNFPFPAGYPRTPLKGSSDAFVVKVDTNQSGSTSLLATMLLGGSAGEGSEGIEVNSDGVFVGGLTSSTNFPSADNSCGSTSPCNDGYLAKLSLDLRSVLYSHYIGGSQSDSQRGLALGPNSLIASTGFVGANFVTKPFSNSIPPHQTSHAGNTDTYVAVFNGNSLTGDFNADGVIDFRDYLLMSQSYLTSNCTYNLVGSTCLVDILDFNAFIPHF